MEEKKVICDTDVMIDYFEELNHRHHSTVREFEKIGLSNISISIVTHLEIISGAKSKSDLDRLLTALRRFDLILISDDVCFEAIRLLTAYRLSHNLSLQDGLIAATAYIGNLKLFTYNKRDFRFIKGIELY